MRRQSWLSPFLRLGERWVEMFTSERIAGSMESTSCGVSPLYKWHTTDATARVIRESASLWK